MGKCIKKINQKISVFIVCLIVFTMLPINFAYGGTAPNVKNMKKTTLGHMYTGCFSQKKMLKIFLQHFFGGCFYSLILSLVMSPIFLQPVIIIVSRNSAPIFSV
jgi:hypothetical protein